MNTSAADDEVTRNGDNGGDNAVTTEDKHTKMESGMAGT
jgi:hypothetical protein